MSVQTSVFLTPKSSVRVIDLAGGAPAIMLDVDPETRDTVTLYLGNLYQEDTQAALAQLGELQAAISAAYGILGEPQAVEPMGGWEPRS